MSWRTALQSSHLTIKAGPFCAECLPQQYHQSIITAPKQGTRDLAEATHPSLSATGCQ